MSRSSFGKREREQAKKQKASAKRDRRQRATSDAEAPGSDVQAPSKREDGSTDTVLPLLASLHEQYDAGAISFDDFEAAKAELLSRLTVD